MAAIASKRARTEADVLQVLDIAVWRHPETARIVRSLSKGCRDLPTVERLANPLYSSFWDCPDDGNGTGKVFNQHEYIVERLRSAYSFDNYYSRTWRFQPFKASLLWGVDLDWVVTPEIYRSLLELTATFFITQISATLRPRKVPYPSHWRNQEQYYYPTHKDFYTCARKMVHYLEDLKFALSGFTSAVTMHGPFYTLVPSPWTLKQPLLQDVYGQRSAYGSLFEDCVKGWLCNAPFKGEHVASKETAFSKFQCQRRRTSI